MMVTPFDPLYQKTHATRKLYGSMLYIQPELLPIEVLHCWNKYCRPFFSCDLDLYPMTFIYEPDLHFMEIYYIRYASINFLR